MGAAIVPLIQYGLPLAVSGITYLVGRIHGRNAAVKSMKAKDAVKAEFLANQGKQG